LYLLFGKNTENEVKKNIQKKSAIPNPFSESDANKDLKAK
jgi:hypothetical protein